MISTKIDIIYSVSLPAAVKKILESLSMVVGLGLGGVATTPLECLGLAGYVPRLLFWMVLPFVLSMIIVAVVILPEHLHALITMRDTVDDYPRLWQDIKKGFTRRVGTRSSPWQPRYWEHTIRDQDDLQAHADYIHINPVKHGLVERAIDWPHSSFHKFLRRGLLPADWASSGSFSGRFGEPEE